MYYSNYLCVNAFITQSITKEPQSTTEVKSAIRELLSRAY